MDCSVLPMESGSRTGISRNNSAFQRVRVILLEPFAPAKKVSVGRLIVNGKTMSCGLSHLLREFQPFSSHEIKDTPSG